MILFFTGLLVDFHSESLESLALCRAAYFSGFFILGGIFELEDAGRVQRTRFFFWERGQIFF